MWVVPTCSSLIHVLTDLRSSPNMKINSFIYCLFCLIFMFCDLKGDTKWQLWCHSDGFYTEGSELSADISRCKPLTNAHEFSSHLLCIIQHMRKILASPDIVWWNCQNSEHFFTCIYRPQTLTLLFFCLLVCKPRIFEVQSKGISRKLNMWHFQFSIWLKLGEVHFAENPTWTSGSKVITTERFSKQ